MENNPLGPLRGLANAFEYLLLLACLYALNTLVVPILFGLGCAYLLARRCWGWCRRPPDCPASRVLRSALVAALAGAPFFFLLAVARLTK